MPRNRADQDREGKREAIILAAGRLFARDGFERATVAAIAAEAEITKNTVYWYFDDKDALLVAVLTRAYASASRSLRDGVDPLAARLVRLVEAFAQTESLTTTLHARLGLSAALREWHEGFHASGDRWLAREIQTHLARQALPALPEDTAATVVRLWSMAIEGMVTHTPAAEDRLAMCTLLVAQVEAQAAAGGGVPGNQASPGDTARARQRPAT